MTYFPQTRKVEVEDSKKYITNTEERDVSTTCPLSILRSGNDLLFRRVYCFSMCVTQDISLETNLLWAPSIKLQIH